MKKDTFEFILHIETNFWKEENVQNSQKAENSQKSVDKPVLVRYNIKAVLRKRRRPKEFFGEFKKVLDTVMKLWYNDWVTRHRGQMVFEN